MVRMRQILAIETSCDETAAGVMEDGRHILSNVVASQTELHRIYGGVFPEVASRQHVLAVVPVVREALALAGVKAIGELDAIAVTVGPGLAGSLLVGVNVAKGLSLASGLPLLAVNHLEGHIYSNWIIPEYGSQPMPEDDFPVVVLIVSGGHTELTVMTGHGRYRRLGGTLDDAAGEAFDKVARLLGLGYPGGPAIQRAAAGGDPAAFPLPRPLLQSGDQHRFNFSFSGLKTATLKLVRELEAEGADLASRPVVSDIAASFQQAVAAVLVAKSVDAAVSWGAHRLCICGGVSANQALRRLAEERCAQIGLPLHRPPLPLCTDNAAMIGAAAYYGSRHRSGISTSLDQDISANLRLTEVI